MQNNYPTYLIFFLTFLIMGGCSLFENEQSGECIFQDYGVETGYYIYNLDKEKIPWIRDRNYLSIKFKESTSNQEIQQILENNDLIINDQVGDVKHYKVGCLKQPAEFYYSNSLSSINELKNNASVEYSLPVFLNEFKETILLTNTIKLEFKNLSKESESEVIDSLILSDKLVLLKNPETEGQTYRLNSTKESKENSLELSNRYTLFLNVKFAVPDYAFKIE